MIGTHTYRFCEHLLASNVLLPELVRHERQVADLSFELLRPTESVPESAIWFRGWRLADEDEAWWLRFGEMDGEYLLRFPGYADFQVSPDGRTIRCQPVLDVPLVTIRHFLLDQVLPLALSLGGEFVLHASAVDVGGHAIGVAGTTGRGKSTLAASFAAAAYPLFADDCLVLKESGEEWLVLPYYAGVRLWPESVSLLFPHVSGDSAVAHYTHKRRVGGSMVPFAQAIRPLRHVFVLQDGDGHAPCDRIVIEPLTAKEAFFALLETNFLVDTRSRSTLKRQFDQLGRLTEAIPCSALAYPRDHAILADVRAAVLSTVAGDGNSPRHAC